MSSRQSQFVFNATGQTSSVQFGNRSPTGFYPAIQTPLDIYRAAHPESTPAEVWGALTTWMRAQ